MAKLSFWDKQSDIEAPLQHYSADEYMEQHPWTKHAKVVLGLSRGVAQSVDNLAVLCDVYKVPDDLDDDAALAYIEQQIAEQHRQAEAAAQQPTAEERIAAAMEFQNLNIL